jgi:hypothetical protein
VWLHGEQSGRRAWLLDHAFGGRGFEQAWLVGSSVEATLSFFPGASALRALSADAPTTLGPAIWPRAALSDEWASIARRVAACPWIALHPLVIPDAVPVDANGQLLAVAEGRALKLVMVEADQWKLLAASGGRPCHLVGEWDGHELKPLTAWADNTSAPLWQRSAS